MAVIISFDEILLDDKLFNLGFATGGPELANVNLRNPQTGVPSVAVLRLDPLVVWQVDFSDIKHPDPAGLQYFNNIWYGGLGSAYGLRVRNQWDYFTQGEVLGTGNAVLQDFKLTKKYRRPGTTSHDYIRRICKPVATANLSVDSVTLKEADGSINRVLGSGTFTQAFSVYLGGTIQPTGWTISNTTGILHFNTAPGNGVSVSVDFQFDTPMQFWTNLPNLKADFPAEARALSMIEIPAVALGIT